MPIGLGVHPLLPELLHDDLGAAAGLEARLAARDRDGLHVSAVDVDGHLVGPASALMIFASPTWNDPAVELAVDAVAGGDAVDVDVDGDLGARLPVVRRPPVRLAAGDPAPRALLRGTDLTVIFFSKAALSFTGTSNRTMTGMATPTVCRRAATTLG